MFVYETQYDRIAMVQLYYAISSVLSESQGIWKKLEQNKFDLLDVKGTDPFSEIAANATMGVCQSRLS